MLITNTNDFTKIGGEVEIDETCLCKNKYGKGALLASQLRHLWIVGFIERRTKKRYMSRVYRRNIKYMDKLMVSILAPGCTIYTDKFRTYQNFITRNPDLVQSHKSINHKQNFVDPKDKSIHTQTIESNWKQAKKAIKCYRSLDVIDEYIAEYQYRCNYFVKEKHSYGQSYLALLKDIARVCPPQGYEGIFEQEVVEPEVMDGFPEDIEPAEDEADDQEAFYIPEELMSKVQFDRYTRKQLEKELADCFSDSDVEEPIQEKNESLTERIEAWINKEKSIDYSGNGLIVVTSETILSLIGKTRSGWLDDDAINAYLMLLKAKYSTGSRLIAITDSRFFPCLENKTNYSKWVDEESLTSASIVFIPIFKANHWFLAVVDHDSKAFYIFNSIAGRHRLEMNLIKSFLEQLHSRRGLPRLDEYVHRYCLSKRDVPQQTNYNDCGVYTLLFAKIIASGGKISGKSIAPQNIPTHVSI